MLDAWPPAVAHPWPLPIATGACAVVAVLTGREELVAAFCLGGLALGCLAGAARPAQASVRLALAGAGGIAAVAALPVLLVPAAQGGLGLRIACALVILVCGAAGIELNRRGP